MNQKTPSMTITNKSIRFNKAMLVKMENCKYIEILYHPILKMIAVKETTENNCYAISWTSKDGTLKASLNFSALSKSIYERTGWIKEYQFKFRGITRIRGNQKIVFFYLDEPLIIPDKKTKKRIEQSTDEASAQYIEYKENASEACSIPSKRVLISENWANQNRFGISLSQRQKRDWIVHSVSEEDINVKGICVDNPLIGALPSQTAISDELEKLISSM